MPRLRARLTRRLRIVVLRPLHPLQHTLRLRKKRIEIFLALLIQSNRPNTQARSRAETRLMKPPRRRGLHVVNVPSPPPARSAPRRVVVT